MLNRYTSGRGNSTGGRGISSPLAREDRAPKALLGPLLTAPKRDNIKLAYYPPVMISQTGQQAAHSSTGAMSPVTTSKGMLPTRALRPSARLGEHADLDNARMAASIKRPSTPLPGNPVIYETKRPAILIPTLVLPASVGQNDRAYPKKETYAPSGTPSKSNLGYGLVRGGNADGFDADLESQYEERKVWGDKKGRFSKNKTIGK